MRIVIALLMVGGTAFSQARFEVASVKPSSGEFIPSGPGTFSRVTITDSRVSISGQSLERLVEMAYAVKPYQVAGPGWMASAKFDVLATIPEGMGKDRFPEMLQTLLAERFRLTTHRATSDQPVWGLTVSKNGPKLQESGAAGAIADDSGNVELANGNRGVLGKLVIRDSGFGPATMSIENGVLHFEYSQMTLSGLTQLLSSGQLQQLLGLPVVDRTGITGHYQIALDISQSDMLATIPPEVRAPSPAGADEHALADPPGKSLFSSIEKLGLRLERTKAPMEQIVIDHVEKVPAEN